MKLSSRLMAVTCVLVTFQLVAVVGLAKTLNDDPFVRPYFATPVTDLGTPVEPLADHVVVFVFDGARYDVLMNETVAPNLKRLRDGGVVYTDHRTNYPSVSRPSYATLGTGNFPYQHQIVSNEIDIHPATETIFNVTRGAGMTSAAIAFSWYRDLFGPWLDQWIGNDSLQGYEETKAYSAELQKLVQSPATFPNLTFVHFLETDEVGHAHGGLSPQAREAATHEDAAVGDFLDALAATPLLSSRTAVIVTCDHGMTDSDEGSGLGKGTHGLSSDAETHVPLFIWGPGVKQGVEVSAPSNHVDLAETIAYILGTRVPADSAGTVLFDAFSGAGEADNARENVYLHHLVYRNLAQLDRLQASNWRLSRARLEMVLLEETPDQERAEADALLASDSPTRQDDLRALAEKTHGAYEAVWRAQAARLGTWQLVPFLLLVLTSIVVTLAVLKGESEKVSFATMNLKNPKFLFTLASVGATVAILVPCKYHARAIVGAGIWPLVDTAPLVGATLNVGIPLLALFGVALWKGRDGEEKLAMVGLAALVANLASVTVGVGIQAYHYGITGTIAPFDDLLGVMLGYYYLTGLLFFVTFFLAFVVGKLAMSRAGKSRAEPED
ncbi:MAG: alkaline phosphatase family protein [Promethearchaeota archaeon]